MLQPPTADQPKKRHRLLPLLSGVLMVAVLAGALLFSMSAGSEAHAASVTKPTSSLELTQHTSTVLRTSRTNAGDPCYVFTSYLTYGTLGHKNEMWLKLVTTWCYNYAIVTSHNTVFYWGVTAGGSGDGWSWIYGPNTSFNCYNAADNLRCSGNHEHAAQTFINGFLKDEAVLTIDQYEIYTGQSFNTFNDYVCPGGC
jgi:hypothetical protein